MLSDAPFDTKSLAAMFGMPSTGADMGMKMTPTDFKVVVGNEDKLYTAFLAGTDSNLGLAFIKIEDLGDRALQPVDLRLRTRPPLVTRCTRLAGSVRATTMRLSWTQGGFTVKLPNRSKHGWSQELEASDCCIYLGRQRTGNGRNRAFRRHRQSVERKRHGYGHVNANVRRPGCSKRNEHIPSSLVSLRQCSRPRQTAGYNSRSKARRGQSRNPAKPAQLRPRRLQRAQHHRQRSRVLYLFLGGMSFETCFTTLLAGAVLTCMCYHAQHRRWKTTLLTWTQSW